MFCLTYAHSHPPTHTHRADEWVLWNYPFGHDYVVPGRPWSGPRPARPVAPAAPAPAIVFPVAQDPLPTPSVQRDAQVEDSAAEGQVHVPVVHVAPSLPQPVPVQGAVDTVLPINKHKQTKKTSLPQPVQVAVDKGLVVSRHKQTGEVKQVSANYTCTPSGYIVAPVLKRKHVCTHHTSCVVGKCSECPCKPCKANQVSGKRARKTKLNDSA